jgi:hypothetical protein
MQQVKVCTCCILSAITLLASPAAQPEARDPWRALRQQ